MWEVKGCWELFFLMQSNVQKFEDCELRFFMEKLFLCLRRNSSDIFSVATAVKELGNTSASMIDSCIKALEMFNLIYLAKSMNVGSKSTLKILCKVKYRSNSHIAAKDAIVELCNDEKSKVTSAFLITKRIEDFGIVKNENKTPSLRIHAIAFLYILGKAEVDGQSGKMYHLEDERRRLSSGWYFYFGENIGSIF